MLDTSFETNRFDAFGRKKSSTAGANKRMTDNGFHKSTSAVDHFDVIHETVATRKRKTAERKIKDEDSVYDDVIKALSESRPMQP